MSIVTKILYKQKLKSTKGKDYVLTTLLLDDGTEVDTTEDIRAGDKVHAWLDEKWDKIKVARVK
jgi:hypothetical protein